MAEHHRRAGPYAQTTERAFYISDCQHPGRDPARAGDKRSRNIHLIDLGSRPNDPCRWLDEPLVAEIVIVGGVCGEAYAACVKMLTGHSVVGVGNLILEEISAQLRVEEKAALAGSEINACELDLQTVLKARRRIETARRGIPHLRSQISDRRAGMQIPSIHIQSGDVSADLNAAEIAHRARVANDVAGNSPAKIDVARRCSRAEREMAGHAARPDAAALLIRLRHRGRGNEG